MGYYTNFEFGVEDYGKSNVTDRKIVEKIFELNAADTKEDRFYPLIMAIEEDGGIESYDNEYITHTGLELITEEAKWYTNNEDMIMLSKAFPDVTFVLAGDGEETGDVWKTYYKNGLSHTYTPMMPDFNPIHLDPNINNADMEMECVELITTISSMFDELKRKFPNTALVTSSLDSVKTVEDLDIGIDVDTENGISMHIFSKDFA